VYKRRGFAPDLFRGIEIVRVLITYKVEIGETSL